MAERLRRHLHKKLCPSAHSSEGTSTSDELTSDGFTSDDLSSMDGSAYDNSIPDAEGNLRAVVFAEHEDPEPMTLDTMAERLRQALAQRNRALVHNSSEGTSTSDEFTSDGFTSDDLSSMDGSAYDNSIPDAEGNLRAAVFAEHEDPEPMTLDTLAARLRQALAQRNHALEHNSSEGTSTSDESFSTELSSSYSTDPSEGSRSDEGDSLLTHGANADGVRRDHEESVQLYEEEQGDEEDEERDVSLELDEHSEAAE